MTEFSLLTQTWRVIKSSQAKLLQEKNFAIQSGICKDYVLRFNSQ